MEALDRFWAKVRVVPSGCWEWQGANDGRQGYGKFKVGGRSVRAIRWIFEVYFPGKLRAHHVVMHTCDNPRCVRPDHLKLGTHRQNMRDKSRKGRVVVRPAFLTEDTVSLIKFAASEGASPRLIARELEIKYTTVRAVTEGRRWKHVA